MIINCRETGVRLFIYLFIYLFTVCFQTGLTPALYRNVISASAGLSPTEGPQSLRNTSSFVLLFFKQTNDSHLSRNPMDSGREAFSGLPHIDRAVNVDEY
jgi:hypothetical protein